MSSLSLLVNRPKYLVGNDKFTFEDYEDGFRLLHKTLTDYLSNLRYTDLKKESYAATLVKTLVDKNFAGDILSYNYTDLNLLINRLGYSSTVEYEHVHGSLKDDNIIIGFQDDLDIHEECCFMIKSFSPHYKSHNIRKRLLEADEIIFFGHSLGASDYHYFQDLFSRQSDANLANNNLIIRIFTNNESSRRDILIQLRNMNNKRTNYLYGLCNFEIYRTNPEYGDNDKITEYFNQLKKRLDENAERNSRPPIY